MAKLTTVGRVSRKKFRRRSLAVDPAAAGESFLETALGSAPGIFIVVDRAGKFIRWSESMKLLTGRSEQELRGETMLSFVPQEDQERFIVQLEEAIVGGNAQGEIRLRLDGEETRNYLLSARHFDVEGRPYIVCVGMDCSGFNRLEQALEREKLISDTIIESAPGAFFMIDQNLNLVRWNKYLADETGLTGAQLRGASILRTIVEEDRPLAAAKFLTAFATGFTRMEVGVQTPDRGIRQFSKSGRRFTIDGVPYVAGYCIDITEHKEAEDALSREKAFSDALIESIPGAFYVLDDEGNYFRWNSLLRKLTGLSEGEMAHRPALLTVHDEDWGIATAAMKDAFENGYAQAEVRVTSHDRDIRTYLLTAQRFRVADATYLVGVGIDTTERKARMAELQHDANTDALTQIPNRKQFTDIGHQEFARARRFGHPLSLWMLDVDHFKSINDTYGHDAGDLALQSLVQVGRRALRDWDVLGRWGGEEFAVLLPETESEQALLVAERLRQAVAAMPMPAGRERSAHLTVSIGIATVQDGDGALESLMERADKALYMAKNTGRDKVCVAEQVLP